MQRNFVNFRVGTVMCRKFSQIRKNNLQCAGIHENDTQRNFVNFRVGTVMCRKLSQIPKNNLQIFPGLQWITPHFTDVSNHIFPFIFSDPQSKLDVELRRCCMNKGQVNLLVIDSSTYF